MLPDELKYTSEHEWVRTDGAEWTVGITDYAQQALGDIVFVELPEVGLEVQRGQAVGVAESTKAVSDVYAPVSGTVVARNDVLDGRPELVNEEPYGGGWLFRIAPRDAGEADGLLDASSYAQNLGDN